MRLISLRRDACSSLRAKRACNAGTSAPLSYQRQLAGVRRILRRRSNVFHHMTIENSTLAQVAGDAMTMWHRYLDVFEPLRPDLYRFCRALTRNAWDAEDLVQDVLARGFVTLADRKSTRLNSSH